MAEGDFAALVHERAGGARIPGVGGGGHLPRGAGAGGVLHHHRLGEPDATAGRTATARRCPRCGKRAPAEVIAEVNTTFYEGIRRAGSGQTLIAWDWGWHDDWVEEIIARLPREVQLHERQRMGHADQAGRRGYDRRANIPFRLSAPGSGRGITGEWPVPRGCAPLPRCNAAIRGNFRRCPTSRRWPTSRAMPPTFAALGVNGLMLGWTLGGYPSPNLEVVAEIGAAPAAGAAG